MKLSEETRLRFERLALDSNAAIDLLRRDRPNPAPLLEAKTLVLPLFVLAELKFGALRSAGTEENLRASAALAARCEVLVPDEGTTDRYAQIRVQVEAARTLPQNRQRLEGLHHDLWVAALCLQHRLPLLTNDRDFDGIEGLELIRW